MEKVLVVGGSSYIARSFCEYARQRLALVAVDSHEQWKTTNFTGFDSVIFCGGIVHRKQTAANQALYMQVNCRLALEVAAKAKGAGVGHFVYLSSMAVYGRDSGVIGRGSQPSPRPGDAYAASKYAAEQQLAALVGEGAALRIGGGAPVGEGAAFRLTILRPPMVYGPGCPGNYPRLVSLVKRLPFFPDIQNQRSAVHIDVLCEFLTCLLETAPAGSPVSATEILPAHIAVGAPATAPPTCTDVVAPAPPPPAATRIFHPQDPAYFNTTAMAKQIAADAGKPLRLTKAFNPLIRALSPHISQLQKLFGDLTYAKDIDLPRP